MKLSIGIIGLPNVGKSTLFNALLKKSVAHVANYPFATIEPNVGVVEVPDERLEKLANVAAREQSYHIGGVHSAAPEESLNRPPIVPAAVEFYDIAGLVKGASTGEGLGNKFLSHIREVAAIVHVVRLFEDRDVTHVSAAIDAKSDIETIEQELILADLGTLEKSPFAKAPKDKQKDSILLYETIKRLTSELDKGIAARNVELSEEQRKIIKPLNLLTIKPVIYVFNVSEEQLEKKQETNNKIQTILSSVSNYILKISWLCLAAKLESEIVALSDNEQQEYLKQYGLAESGLNRLIKKAYATLGLISFLTAGEKEVRAWTITKGTLALQAAGVIHTDFEKNFIKAEIVPYETFVELGGWQKCREAGKVTLAGKDYEMCDGDVVEFKVGI